MNTRTYFRNSTLAFPHTAEYGASIERPQRRLSWVRVGLLMMFIIAFALVYGK